jgi:lincosamide nucleotidyltransferase A/C/D/E
LEEPKKAVMPAETVRELVQLFDEHGIQVIVDGGWGVDVLLGEQTRPHADLDIALPHKFVPEVRKLLLVHGYLDVPRPDKRECNFVMGDEKGHLVDIHTYTYDEQGNLTFGLPYPLDSLAGRGTILGYPVTCITPEWLVKFHTGYPLDENDLQDVKRLCQRFGIPLPGEYAKFS